MNPELDDPIDDPVAEFEAIEEEIYRRTFSRRLRDSIPRIFHPFFSPARYKGAHGGRGSAKSWTFAALIVLLCLDKPGTRVVCIREVQKSLGQSVKRLLEDTIARFELSMQFRILNNVIVTPGDGLIIFQGMQDHTADSIKSLEGFDIAWVEEAQSLSQRSMDLLRPTLRKDSSELWFTWNPRRATDPVDSLLRVSPPPNSIVKQVNYTHNPFLPKVLRDELEWDQKRDREKFEHIWLGAYERHSEARVFKNWRVEEFDTPENTISFLLGGDWGFSVDPTCLVRCYPVVRNLYIDYERYQVGVEIDHTPAFFDGLACTKDHDHFALNPDGTYGGGCDGWAREWKITTDSARPETISYMQRHGYPGVIGAKKGKDSVKEGIQFLKTYDIIVHPRCRHVIDELTNYSYKKHPLTDEILPILADDKNHVIDSLRYAAESLRQPEDKGLTW